MSKVFNASRLLRGSAYGILGIPMLILWVSIFVPLVSTAAGLMIIGVGFVLLAITLRAAGLAATVERWLIYETLGIEISRPQREPTGPNIRNLALDPLRDGSYWRELAFIGVRSVIGSAAAVIVVVAWTFPVFAFSSIFWGWSTDWDFGVFVMFLVLGAASLVVGPLLIVLITELQVAAAHSLLGLGHRELIERADTAQRHRDLSVEGAEAERRRIERDLHDGAQARLATVAMDLGRAKRKLEQQGGDDEIGAIIDSAHHDAKAAIVELRNLARGIHPAVLTDRGLDAALSDLAARCTVPVHLDVQLATRPAAHIESAAYFAVSELLANISKHSNATNAWVTVRSDDTELRMDISDDGLGGVDPSIGSGIRGLQDRIASLDGMFTVTSPLAGGTSAIVEIPFSKAGS